MKKTLKTIIMTILVLMIWSSSNAQLVNVTASSFNDFSQTDASKSTESVGVGDFAGAGTDPRAALNVNTNFLGGLTNIPPSYGSFGEVFRTDAPDRPDNVDIFSFWRMYTT